MPITNKKDKELYTSYKLSSSELPTQCQGQTTSKRSKSSVNKYTCKRLVCTYTCSGY